MMRFLKIPLLFFAFVNIAMAAPGPLGYHLGKSTLQDIKEKYNVQEMAGGWNCPGIYVPYEILDVEKSGLDGIHNAWFTVDGDNTLIGFSITLEFYQYKFALQSLSENYKFVRNGEKLRSKQVFFQMAGTKLF